MWWWGGGGAFGRGTGEGARVWIVGVELVICDHEGRGNLDL